MCVSKLVLPFDLTDNKPKAKRASVGPRQKRQVAVEKSQSAYPGPSGAMTKKQSTGPTSPRRNSGCKQGPHSNQPKNLTISTSQKGHSKVDRALRPSPSPPPRPSSPNIIIPPLYQVGRLIVLCTRCDE